VKPYSGGIRHDYKDTLFDPVATQRRHWSWFLIGLVAPIIAVSLFLISGPNESKILPATSYRPQGPIQEVSLALPQPPGEPAEAARPARRQAPEGPEAGELTLIVRSGDSLELLFRRNDLSLGDLAMLARLPDVGRRLTLLRPGDEIRLTRQGRQVTSLTRELDEFTALKVSRGASGFEVRIAEREVETRAVSAHGIIQASLFEAAQDAGISDMVTMNMAGIFQWDIDFIQDVRIGDEFTVIYEELWREGVKLRDSEIVAAEFINQSSPYRAARYTDGNGTSGYFTPEGRSVRKAFLRAPVDFTRISSNFDPSRRHPMLNSIRAHRGVDYAAPTGTAIRAAGDGKVSFRSVRNGYGNTVILQHGGNITTLYAHMSRFAKPRVGSRVSQGQIIGYVGRSGLATGPHLHYEYRISGVHRNPRTVPLPPADPVPAEYWEDFQASAAPLWHQLDLYRRTRLATASN